MPISSLLLALAMVFPAHGRGDSTVVIPPSPQIQPSSPADSQWQHLVDLDRTHQAAKSIGIGTAVGGGGLITIAILAWAFDGLIEAGSSTSNGQADQSHPLQTLEALTGTLGAACELVAGGSAIYAVVLSHRIEAYEHKTRYRLSFHPLVLPTDRAAGAVAQVGF